jgi:hypothetical protein
MMVPTKMERVPRVAELPTCQKTLHELAPLMSCTELVDAVVRVVGAWKTQTELGSFWPSSVRLPVRSRLLPAAYTPGARVNPPSVPWVAVTGSPAATRNAAVRAIWACAPTASAAWIVPLTVPGGNPVTAVPGETPRFPVTVVPPVLVTVEPARTANGAAVPSSTGAGPAAYAIGAAASMPRARVTNMPAESGNLAPRTRVFTVAPLWKVLVTTRSREYTRHEPPDVDSELSIHPLNASGFPTGWALSSGSASAATNDAFLWFSMSSAYFTAGQHLASVIHVVPNAPYKCDVRGSDANPYSRGMAQQFSNGAWRGLQLNTVTDFAFRTYVVLPTATPTPSPTPAPTAHPTAQPTPHPTAQPTLAATPSSPPTATPMATSTEAPVAAETPAGTESPAAAGSSGSAATTTGTFTPGGSAGSGGTNDLPLPAILAAIAAPVAVLGGLAFLLLRRCRQAET